MPTQLAHPSPKRKRDQPPPAPLLNTALALRPASTPRRSDHRPSSGPDSPRNAVAEQLRGMTLTTIAPIPMSPLTPTDDAIRKKPKLDATRVDSAISPTTEKDTTTTYGRLVATNCKNRPFADTVHVTSGFEDSRDDEITGHLADPAIDPDDDGTGLNGIGFKPTPALAYARSQKRRQQLNEWKLREMRDARAKRSERRRGGVRGTPSRETTVEREVVPAKAMTRTTTTTKRTVKFAI
ncbi:hypothetical protein PtrM4_069590 [Pyrenophora tritici-repentis]|uniref:Uncharacterized protein n=1 Tax=Pyrenophora tritici-repentis TaxID=45151 RepID=A0A834VTD9_9PLEO|nr:hypothetical protein A1F99_033320 [Pyrenophora tritici-repentis]KAF7575335.1 hypothetical protein PtrM4_069590 [Pyrenophora tritici-repentis]